MSKKKIFLFSKESKAGLGTFFNNLSYLGLVYDLSLTLFKRETSFSKTINLNTTYIDSDYPSGFNFSTIKIFKYISNVVRTALIIRNSKPEIVCCNDTYSALVILPLRFVFPRLAIVVIVHIDLLQTINYKKGRLFKLLLMSVYGFLLHFSSKLIFVSQGTKKEYKKRFNLKKDQLRTIYYGIKLPNKTLKTRVYKTKNKWKLISIGRFEHQKDFQTIIKAVKILIEKYNIELTLVGEGGQKKHLIKLAKQLGITKNIIFAGWKTQAEVYKVMRSHDVFIFSSNYETFGLTIIEALALGIPVISTNTEYGPAESLNNGEFGILVPVGNSQKMADAVELVMTDSNLEKRLINLGLNRSKDFSDKLMNDNYIKLFNSLST